MTTRTLVTAGTVALSLTALTGGLLILGLVLMINTRERKLATWAGDKDE